MPIRRNTYTYACKFRCGFVRISKKRIETHEKGCFNKAKKQGYDKYKKTHKELDK